MSANSDGTIYKRPDSPYFWYFFSINGRKYRGSTKTDNEEQAIEHLKEVSNRLSHPGREYAKRKSQKTSWGVEVSDKKSDTWQALLRTLHSAKGRKGKECSLTIKDLSEIALRSNGNCEVTGITFDCSKTGLQSKNAFAPSLDRIDTTLGYSIDNCRLVCMIVNYAMNEWGERALFELVLYMLESVNSKSSHHPWDDYIRSAKTSKLILAVENSRKRRKTRRQTPNKHHERICCVTSS